MRAEEEGHVDGRHGIPLGYDVKDSKLVVNKAEARTVARYLGLKSVQALRAELDAAGIRSKRRLRTDGTECGNQRFSKGMLYLMLQNSKMLANLFEDAFQWAPSKVEIDASTEEKRQVTVPNCGRRIYREPLRLHESTRGFGLLITRALLSPLGRSCAVLG